MITLRRANIKDLETLKYWDKQEHVIASDPSDDWNWDYELTRHPEWREQLIAQYNEIAIGFIQIIDPAKEESHYWGNIGLKKRAIDIWIGDKKNLGKRYGTKIINLAIERCFDDPNITEILVDPLESNKRAIHFYKKIGFKFIEKRKFGNDNCEVYSIIKEDWNIKN